MERPPEERGANAGRRPTVVVTRPPGRAAPMVDALSARGADVLLAPSIEIAPPRDPAPLERAAARLGAFDWVAFTSAAGVDALAGAGEEPAERSPGAGPRLAAVGPSTARAVTRALGRRPDLVPEASYSAEGLAEAFEALGALSGSRVLLPLAEAADDLLASRLAALGAEVERVTAYRTVAPGDGSVEDVRRAITDGAVALLTFTSPSTAENFLESVGEEALRVPAAVIGPTTRESALELGFHVVAVATEHTVAGLVDAVFEALGGDGDGAGGGAGQGRPSPTDR